MKVLVINSGSSSLKYQLFEMEPEQCLARGLIERIGEEESHVIHHSGEDKFELHERVADHKAAFEILKSILLKPELGLLCDPGEVDAIGHRVVYGAEEFRSSTLVDDHVIDSIHRFSSIAPLHNPPNLAGIRAARELFPGAPNVAVFDTTFHTDIPPKAFHYAIPYELYERLRIRRYGFHGMSHQYVTHRGAELLGIPLAKFNAITCHLGNGCSMTAVQGGKSADTTLGLTPLPGLVMGTRPGDLDPGVLLHLLREGECTAEELDKMLNKKSGLLGLSGVSNDMREVREAAQQGNERAQLAIDVAAYRMKKYLGSFFAVLGRVDAVIFTGGIGENDAQFREDVTAGLEGLGIAADPYLNAQASGKEAAFNAPASAVKLMVIPTNEELVIARDTRDVASKASV